MIEIDFGVLVVKRELFERKNFSNAEKAEMKHVGTGTVALDTPDGEIGIARMVEKTRDIAVLKGIASDEREIFVCVLIEIEIEKIRLFVLIILISSLFRFLLIDEFSDVFGDKNTIGNVRGATNTPSSFGSAIELKSKVRTI